MKKKLVGILLCLSLTTALLAGCGSTETTTETTEASTETTETAEAAEAGEEDNVIKVSGLETRLQLSNRNLPTQKNGIKSLTKYDLVRDNYGNWKNFSIINKGTEEKPDYFLKFTGN